VRFLYLRDPLFLACVATYFVNRLVLKAIWKTGFVHAHLNDLICIPFWVPIMLWGQRHFRLRRTDGPPDASEIIIPLIVWSWVFEVILPASGLLGELCVADHRDILWYSVGALGAGVFWRWWYGDGLGQSAGGREDEPTPPCCSWLERDRMKHRLEAAGDWLLRHLGRVGHVAGATVWTQAKQYIIAGKRL
jgi:hypothetical protein